MAKARPPTQERKTKEQALESCAELHHTLVTCFKTCSFGSAFTGCCTEEHKAFWECYTRERGTNETRIKSFLDGVFGGSSGPAAAGADQQPAAQQQQQQPPEQQQQQQQQRGGKAHRS